MILFWLATGIIAVTFTYIFSPQSPDPWDPLNTAGLVAGLYLLILLLSTLRKPLHRTTVISGWAAALIAGAATVFVWTGYDAQSHYQAELLSEIRGRISRGVIAHEFSEHLLKVLESYHHQPPRQNRSLGAVFQETVGAGIGSNLHEPSYESDRLRITVASISADEVVLIAEEGYVKGRDLGFRNLDGGMGMVQELARLTAKGITYESQN
ncbi:MAG: hypothetical protein WEB33_12075 [Bacteroidota bacterium]